LTFDLNLLSLLGLPMAHIETNVAVVPIMDKSAVAKQAFTEEPCVSIGGLSVFHCWLLAS
jgi:hypothetical protein